MNSKQMRELVGSIVAITITGSAGAIAAGAAVAALGLTGIFAALVAVPIAMAVAVALFAAGVHLGNMARKRS